MNYYALLEEYNAGIVSWGKGTTKAGREEMSRLGIRRGEHTKTFRSGYGKDRYGEINRVSFHMSRALVYVHKGVGRGTPISKAGEGNGMGRKPKPWFNPIMEKRFEELADHVTNAKADMVANSIFIK